MGVEKEKPNIDLHCFLPEEEDEAEEVEELEALLLGGRGLKPGCVKSASMSVQRRWQGVL
jgi:hypothetical protein